MQDSDEEKTEKHIRKKQDKKLSKHFDIRLNGQQFKIIKYLIKDKVSNERQGKVIQLLSKFNIMIDETKNVKIEITTDTDKLEIIADWASGHWSTGNYNVAYWINKCKKIEYCPTCKE